MNKDLTEDFNKGREVTINANRLHLWDLTIADMKVKIRDSRIYKMEKNPSVAYWLGRMRGKGDLRRERMQPMSEEETSNKI